MFNAVCWPHGLRVGLDMTTGRTWFFCSFAVGDFDENFNGLLSALQAT